MSKLSQDVRHAIRSLQRSPGFALVVVLTLALGIGANTAIFTIVNAVVLRPLPYRSPEQLVRVTSELKKLNADDAGLAPLELFDYQSRTDLFSGVAGLYPVNANVTGGAEPERIETMLVSWNYFSILGSAPALGRVFGPDDDGPGIPQVAVVSDGYWRRRLAADPHAIGRTLVVDGDPFVLVGVMPPAFKHPGFTVGNEEVDLWSPAGYRAMPFGPPNRTRRFLQGALARLQPGVSPARAQQVLDEYAAKQRADFPAEYPEATGWHPRVVSVQQDVVGSVKTPMLILLVAVGFVLLIACANVANLMLTRGSRRHHEMAVRASLGATAGRLARLILTESALLATAGGLLGLLIGSWGLRALIALAPSKLPRITSVALDGPALLISLGLSMAATLLFGLAPALQMRAVNALAAVREGARGRSAGPASTRIRNGLVAVEVALAMVLLVGAGLLARTFWALESVPTGFDTSNLVTAKLWLPRPNDPANGVYLTPEGRVAFTREVLRRASALPQVEQVALSTQVPLGGYNPPIFFEIDGKAAAENARMVIHNFQVSPEYFSTLRIPIADGRGFTDADRADTQPVAIITQAAARRYWPNANPIGSRIRVAPQAPWLTIIGVAGDVLTRGLADAAQPILYRPIEQSSNLALAFLVRTRGNAAGLEEALAREIRAVDPNLPLYSFRSMDDLVAKNTAQQHFLMRVLVAFGAAAVGLALLGIYGVISFAVVQRTREIGIRIAIGAQRRQVLGLVLRQGLTYALAGMVAGIIGGIGAARLISSQLYGVSAFDPASLTAVVFLMTLVAVAAVLVPARRAARIDPIQALRIE
jgi:predicted permease